MSKENSNQAIYRHECAQLAFDHVLKDWIDATGPKNTIDQPL
jgi:hypothetical protein